MTLAELIYRIEREVAEPSTSTLTILIVVEGRYCIPEQVSLDADGRLVISARHWHASDG